MATPFSDIYNVFLSKVNDYEILKYDDSVKESIIERYLVSAQVEFQATCLIDLTDKDNVLKQYNQTLDDEIVEILSTGMVYYWCQKYVNSTDNLRNVLNTSDFSQFSPANLLNSMMELKNSSYKDFKRKINDYSYTHANFDDLKI